MPHSNEAGDVYLESVPRSPINTSANSSRRGSLRQVQPEPRYGPPTPISPPGCLTRKRAASIDVEQANQPRIGELALNSGRVTPLTSETTREQVCLCQPDPKIPRPRNAFILYRQHYQAQVVAQNPGLANPEISKIIGEQWREQAPEVKSDWKRLAEEEKQRHQRQYPGYRYQPRRAGKTNGIHPALSASPEGPTRCPKCHGRYISTPSTPHTPFTPAFGGPGFRPERQPPAFTPSRNPDISENPRYPPHIEQPRMDTPRSIPPQQQMHRRPPYPPNSPLLHAHHGRNENTGMMSPTPEQKRRRFHEAQQQQRAFSISSPSTYAAPQAYARPGGQGPPISAEGYNRSQGLQSQQPFSGSGMVARQGPMGPPPSQKSPMHPPPPPRHHYPTRSSTFDESLRLPPLQTQMPSAPATSSQRPPNLTPATTARESQARSIEAMVMTIPYIQKMRVLNKISPPLAAPGPTSPSQETRGAIIAIEGPDETLLTEVGRFIEGVLKGDKGFSVKTWTVMPEKKAASPISDDVEMTDSSKPWSAEKEKELDTKLLDPFVSYLSVISDMHVKSNEIVKHITTLPSSLSPEINTTNPTPSSAMSPKTTLPSLPSPESTSSSSKPPIPVALLPCGFSLTVSDYFSCQIPINDSYAPVDHWQWMATLWRGIVGPDLTVYVTRVSKEEFARYGGVEVSGGLVVVRIDVDVKGMEEKTERRLGFEVLEWVRGCGNGSGLPSVLRA